MRPRWFAIGCALSILLAAGTIAAQLNTSPKLIGPPLNFPCVNTVTISQTANAQIITGTAGQKIYFCTIVLWNGATAQSANIVEGTGTTCATGTAGLLGGATALTGLSLPASSGLNGMASPAPFMRSKTAADNICVFQSGTTQLSGVVSYVSAP